MLRWLLIVLAACDGGESRKPDPWKTIEQGLSLFDRSSHPDSPRPAKPVKRPAGAVELATVVDPLEIHVTADRTYWITMNDVGDARQFVLHWIPHGKDAAAQGTLVTDYGLTDFATVGPELYVGGSRGDDDNREALILRVTDTKLEPIVRMRSGNDTIGASALRAADGNLYWKERLGRGHGRGPIYVTRFPSKTTRQLLGCSHFDGSHAECPDLVRGARLAIAKRHDGALMQLTPAGATRLPSRCPCGAEVWSYSGDFLVCSPAPAPACPEAKGALLVPFVGGTAIPAGDLTEVEDLVYADGRYYFNGLDGVTRRAAPTAPDELLVEDAHPFVVGGGMLVWREDDRLWRAPLP